MKKYTGKTEVPVYGGSAQRLQEIWFVLSAFLLFVISEAKAAKWKIPALGIPPGVWPMPNPHRMAIPSLEQANRHLIGTAPEGSGAIGRTGQIEHILRLVKCWNDAVESKNGGELKAIACIASALLRRNWNLVNSVGLHVHAIENKPGPGAGPFKPTHTVYKGMLWSRKEQPLKSKAPAKAKRKKK